MVNRVTNREQATVEGAQRVAKEMVLGETFYTFIDDHKELNSTRMQFIIGTDL